MKSNLYTKNEDYLNWIESVKQKVRSTQIRAALAANNELIAFYWDLGKMLHEKATAWGTGFLNHVSMELKNEFSNMSGFSARNLKYCRQFYQFYSSEFQNSEIRQQAVAQIPWGHNILIISKVEKIDEALFYVQETITNYWSRDVLALQLKSNLHERQGKAVNNFKKTLPEPFSDLAQQTLKDPYVLDFMTLTQPFNERDIENQLIIHIRKFLLELGKGFAFVGQQYEIQIADEDYRIDLLFYHIKLKCYVVIDLKNVKFTPESAGKMNFYLSAIDTILKGDDDKPTIGIILCREKNNVIAEFALRDLNKPIGVTEFQLVNELPENLKPSLPTIEELENELKDIK
jgi:predicted nuclease of restriction endonuclease-like (RecB) superfamily